MIRTENLTRIFRTEEIETIALNGVNINVKDGEFVAIMGPSGCGKSTLLNILGLLDTPTEGKYWLGDEEVGHLKERERTAYRKGRIGFVFQNFNLIDELTVEENIDLQLKYLGIGKAERKERVLDILRKVMGASIGDAAWQLAKRFLVSSLVAVVIAIPICVKLMQTYLMDFVHRISFPWWVLLAGAIFTLLIAFVSVIGCTLRTAMSNPIDSIKAE